MMWEAVMMWYLTRALDRWVDRKVEGVKDFYTSWKVLYSALHDAQEGRYDIGIGRYGSELLVVRMDRTTGELA